MKEFDPNKRLFVYPVSITAAANAVTPGTMSLDAANDFVLQYMTFYNGGAAAGDLSVKIEDSGSNKGFFKAAVKTDLIFGDGKQAWQVPADTLFRGNSSVSVEITNGTATVRSVQLCFIGYKTPPGYMLKQQTKRTGRVTIEE